MPKSSRWVFLSRRENGRQLVSLSGLRLSGRVIVLLVQAQRRSQFSALDALVLLSQFVASLQATAPSSQTPLLTLAANFRLQQAIVTYTCMA